MRRDERPERRMIHMYTANMWAERSLCYRARVGCIITSYDNRQVLAIGYNGPAASLPDKACTGYEGSCECLHAEENALLKVDTKHFQSLNLYTTMFPCYMCAQRIIQNQHVSRLFYTNDYRDGERARALLSGADIDIIHLDTDPNGSELFTTFSFPPASRDLE